MLLDRWEGAPVGDAGGTEPPSPAEWAPVDLPGRPARFAGEDAVAYRTRFDDPRKGTDTRARVLLKGLYAHADVWINGDHLGRHDAYFAPARYSFEPDSENELVVVCRRPDRFGGSYETDLVPDDAAVPAIWWDARVEGKPAAYVENLDVTPRIDGDDASIDARLTVDAAESVSEHVTFSLRPEGFRGGGMMERATLDAEAGERVAVEKTIEVRDPQYWWPWDVGPQNRYAVRAKLGDDEVETTTGLRTVERDEDGLRVNGQTYRTRGFNLLPGDAHRVDVERAVEANATLVRAHAHVPPRELWEAADEAGVLVWQDLPLTGPAAYDDERALALAERLVAATHRHPSVGLYGVHDDPATVTDGLAGARFARHRLRWRAWRASGLRRPPAAVLDAFPTDAAVVPMVGEPGTGAEGAALYPGWRFGAPEDVDWLLDWRPDLGDVVAEFGAGALGTGDVDDVAGFDADAHARYVTDGGADVSQAYQARALKTVAERLRRHGADAVVAFALRDTGDAGMGVITRDGDPKAGFQALADSFEPVQAVLDAPARGASAALVVVNDAGSAASGSVDWSAGESSGRADVDVAPFDRAEVGTVDIPSDAESVDLTLDLQERAVTNRYHL